jgi:hypothetical protein
MHLEQLYDLEKGKVKKKTKKITVPPGVAALKLVEPHLDMITEQLKMITCARHCISVYKKAL